MRNRGVAEWIVTLHLGQVLIEVMSVCGRNGAVIYLDKLRF